MGAVSTRFDWVTLDSEARTRADVRARFGEPTRTEPDGTREVWYYDTALSGERSPVEGATVLYLPIAPIWWRTRADDGARLVFEGDRVVAAAERRARPCGFYCGFNPAAPGFFMCGRVP